MASTHRAPKQWCLPKTETVTTFENWKQNLQYTLSLDQNFSLFLVDGSKWKMTSHPWQRLKGRRLSKKSDFSDIKLEPDERPEDLFQRLMAFVEDNLLAVNGGIAHHLENPKEDEELSPSLENFVVLQWLSLVNKNLPRLVKQRYDTELRSKTLASIKAEISQTLPSLLDELQNSEDARVMRSAPSKAASFSNRQFCPK